MHNTQLKAGEVALVGAGPGDPDLLTVRAVKFIQQAEIVVYDRLVSEEILALIPTQAEKIYVGKKRAQHHYSQPEINELLLQTALTKKRVVRLKGGDPFIFGRGGEELLHLANNGIACHIVPGITAASGCAAYAGIPLTHRGLAQSCTFITGHNQHGTALDLPWLAYAQSQQTLVFYMGIQQIDHIVEQLLSAGKDKSTPAAIIANGTTTTAKQLITTLAELPIEIAKQNIKPPAITIIGESVYALTAHINAQQGYLLPK